MTLTEPESSRGNWHELQSTKPDPVPLTQYTYNRAGLLYTVNDAIGTRVFNYNAAFQLTKEIFDPSDDVFLYNLQVTHTYESSGAHRRTALEVGPSYDTDRDLKDVYAYHSSTGRLSSIAAHYSGGPKTFTYSYLPGTDLVDSVSSGYYERSTYWQSYRRLEDAVETTWNGSLRASYLYGYDLEGRRLAENVTGPIATKFVPSYPNGFITEWNRRGSVQVFMISEVIRPALRRFRRIQSPTTPAVREPSPTATCREPTCRIRSAAGTMNARHIGRCTAGRKAR